MPRALILDCETTDRREGEPVEIAYLRLRQAENLFDDPDDIRPLGAGTDAHDAADTVFVQRYKPSKPVTMGALAVHHILPSELEDCPPSSAFKMPEDVGYLIGHSIDFDWEAIKRPNVKRIDTHAMAQWVWPQATGYSLVALIYMLRGPTPETRRLVRGAHGALADCHLTLALLAAILERHAEMQTWHQLWTFSEECRVPRVCPMKRNQGVLLEDLDGGFIYWCLNQHWLDPYFRIGLERVLKKRQGRPVDAEFDPDDDADDDDEDDSHFHEDGTGDDQADIPF